MCNYICCSFSRLSNMLLWRVTYCPCSFKPIDIIPNPNQLISIGLFWFNSLWFWNYRLPYRVVGHWYTFCRPYKDTYMTCVQNCKLTQCRKVFIDFHNVCKINKIIRYTLSPYWQPCSIEGDIEYHMSGKLWVEKLHL